MACLMVGCRDLQLYLCIFALQGLGSLNTALTPFLYPVIKLSTDLSQRCSVYLLEDGLELWLAVLHNTKEATPDLLKLADNIPPILRE